MSIKTQRLWLARLVLFCPPSWRQKRAGEKRHCRVRCQKGRGEFTKRERKTREFDVRIKGRWRGILDEYKNPMAVALRDQFYFVLQAGDRRELESQTSITHTPTHRWLEYGIFGTCISLTIYASIYTYISIYLTINTLLSTRHEQNFVPAYCLYYIYLCISQNRQ